MMRSSQVRPRFAIKSNLEADALMGRVRERLPQCPHCSGISVGRHAELFVPDAERRLWSPWLSVTVDERGGGSLVRGRFAPHPNVWTLYLFLAFGLGFALLVGTSWGYAQWATEKTPWALMTVPTVIVSGTLLYLVSQFGQKLGGEQMDHLRYTLEELIQ